MSARVVPDLPKWPFFTGNVILLAIAYFLYAQGRGPMNGLEEFLFAACGLAGAILSAAPFVFEYRTAVRMAENSSLISTVGEIKNLEMIAAQINAATARWQVVQEHSSNTVTAAREIAQKITGEAASFTEFLQKANDAERANLRLEVEKMRRMENDWLQVLVRQLDHTWALFKAAERSGQSSLVEQLNLFQNSCRDSARRIGLVPLVPTVGEPLDPRCHRLADSEGEAPAETIIGEIVATGYTYQGRLIRPAMVLAQKEADAENGEDEKDATDDEAEARTLL
jgi:molecular chaperone GrpE (heat shock protein)